jgi:hypothetical protein
MHHFGKFENMVRSTVGQITMDIRKWMLNDSHLAHTSPINVSENQRNIIDMAPHLRRFRKPRKQIDDIHFFSRVVPESPKTKELYGAARSVGVSENQRNITDGEFPLRPGSIHGHKP